MFWPNENREELLARLCSLLDDLQELDSLFGLIDTDRIYLLEKTIEQFQSWIEELESESELDK